MERAKRTRRDYAHSHGPEIFLHRARVAKAREGGRDIIDLGYADIWSEPPRQVAARYSLQLAEERSVHHYGHVQGLPELREEVAKYLSDATATVSSENVVITAGANHGVVSALLATTVPQDQVVVPAPFFFNHVTQIQLVGCTPQPLVTHANEDYVISRGAWARLLARREVGAALLTHPRNPTATELEAAQLRGLLEAAAERGRPVILDESYREFGNRTAQVTWSADGSMIRVGSLSKSFCLAGWRVGYMLVPTAFLDDVIRAQDALMIHPAIASQMVALAAFQVRRENNYVEQLASTIAVRRKRGQEKLSECRWISRTFSEAGTFLWALLRGERFADEVSARLLTESGVGVLPGTAFGPGGEHCLRIGIGCVSAEALEDALDRLVAWGG